MDIKQRSLKFYFHIMKLFAPILISLSLIGQSFAHDPATEMATAAKNFLDSLDESKKKKATFSFSNKERENWHFFPGSFVQPNGRMGLSVKEMTSPQRTLAQTLLSSALSHRGQIEASTVILLENILYEKEAREMRNPDHYHYTIFGNPDKAGTWGWRFEGHHLSLNFSLVNGRIFSVTPSFCEQARLKLPRENTLDYEFYQMRKPRPLNFLNLYLLHKKRWPFYLIKRPGIFIRDKTIR